ncbi:MAG TPA: 3-deoxy-D-manno-octulosonic acid transferase, partial [Hyphomicrobium sp.]|nr:3-deoxy-D-manno-octulosonic acid transferase [Hyphomicrobium sp.]
WIHAASVGEANAVLPLIDDVLAADAKANVLLTTGTTTSAALAAKRLPERAFHQFVPIDVPQYTARFLDHWRPDLAVFTESDIWPNLVLATAARTIPLALINARMSPRSMKRWRKNARTGRPLFSRFNVVLAQNDAIARTIKGLGAPNVSVSGNLKIDAPAPPVDHAILEKLRIATASRPILLAASTHPGEDAIVAATHAEIAKSYPNILTIIAPRHPDRGAALSAEMAGRGFVTERRSQTPLPSREAQIYIADTIGELGTFYALAPVALIGGSLVEHGGQNPIEAIRHGTAVLTGPYHHNFRDIYEEVLASNGAREVKSADELAAAVQRVLADPNESAALRQGAEAALTKLGGALARTVAALKPFLTARGL